MQNKKYRKREDSKRANKRVKIVEEKVRVEAVETRGEDTGSGGSGFIPGIDNLDVKSYIRWMCLSLTY